jgi:lysine-N-methylase
MAPPISLSALARDSQPVALLDRPLELPQALPELATRAMQRFRCVGPACEDNCCHDFGIDIDRASLDRMRAAASGPAERERIVRLVVLGMRPQGGQPAQNMVQLDDHGGCPMLDLDGGCGVHRRHGEAVLSTTCSVFPRTSLAVEERLEVTGSLACPELARLSLLAKDGLEQDVPLEPVLPRAYVGKRLLPPAADLYGTMFTRTREALLELFQHEEHSLGARFAAAATLAVEVDTFFRRDAAPAGVAEGHLLRRRLDVELASAGTAETLAALNADLAGLPDSPPAVLAAAATLLGERLRLTHAPRFGALVRGALAASGASDGDLDPLRARALLTARRTNLERLAPGLMDRVLGRYARHSLLRNPYTDQPSLLVYLNRLGRDLAALRLLWLGSSRLDAWATGSPGRADDVDPTLGTSVIADAGIEAIQAYTKAVSHNVDFLSAIHAGDDQDGNVRFGSLVLLARFI